MVNYCSSALATQTVKSGWHKLCTSPLHYTTVLYMDLYESTTLGGFGLVSFPDPQHPKLLKVLSDECSTY